MLRQPLIYFVEIPQGVNMRNLIRLNLYAAILMIGFPFLVVTFAKTAGMAICFILFFAINPAFCIICGILAGRNLRRLWSLPLSSAALFLVGVWLFFAPGEIAFFVYFARYLIIGIAAMLISALLFKRKA